MGHSHRNLASYFQIDLSKKDSLLWEKKKKECLLSGGPVG